MSKKKKYQIHDESGPFPTIHPAVIHINSTPEFLADPAAVKMINKLVTAALQMDESQKPPTKYL